MESTKKVTIGSSSSSSSFVDLFGPKDSSKQPSSAGHFSSVLGLSSTGLSGFSKQTRNQNSAKYETQDYKTPKSYGKSGSTHSKDSSTSYQNETLEPCNFSSSIYYGGQEEVYSADIQSKNTQSAFKKDRGDDDSNGNNINSASRGNWWKGSLYY